MRRFALTPLLVLVLFAGSCCCQPGPDECGNPLLPCEDDPDFTHGCAVPIEVSVQLSETPIFSWSPTCTVNSLEVYLCVGGECPTEYVEWGRDWDDLNSSGVQEKWDLVTIFNNQLGSGIRYGEVPAGVWTNWPTGARSLLPDSSYLISLGVVAGSAAGSLKSVAGGAVFQMPPG